MTTSDILETLWWWLPMILLGTWIRAAAEIARRKTFRWRMLIPDTDIGIVITVSMLMTMAFMRHTEQWTGKMLLMINITTSLFAMLLVDNAWFGKGIRGYTLLSRGYDRLLKENKELEEMIVKTTDMADLKLRYTRYRSEAATFWSDAQARRIREESEP